MRKSTIILLLLLANLSVKAQNGFFIYETKVPGQPHVQVTDMQEGAHKNLYLAGQSSDEEFKRSSPVFMEVNHKGEWVDELHLDPFVLDVKRLVLTGQTRCLLYGDGLSANETSLTALNGISSKVLDNTEVYAGTFGDACTFSNTQTLVVQSAKDKKTKTSNIQLLKVRDKDHTPKAFATLRSEFNETATQVAINRKKEIFIVGFRMIEQDKQPFVYALDSTGKQLWTAIPAVVPGFDNLKVGLDKDENILVIAGYKNVQKGTCNTQIWKADKTGKEIKQFNIPDLKSNGMILLKNGNVVVFGARYKVHDRRFVICKGSFAIIDEQLDLVKQDEMKQTDAPDADLAPLAMSAHPTSSEFNTGIQLSDGRIALAGRIVYPEFTEEAKILGCNYYNESCLLLMSEKGVFRKD